VTAIDRSARVDPRAELASDVEVGAQSVIGPGVVLGPGVVVGPQVVVLGRTRIGAGTRIHAFACIGDEPQHREHYGRGTALEIGERNVLREHVTIHLGTPEGAAGATRVGDDNLLMNGTHVAHDCRVGSHCTFASFSGLAGHVVVEDHAFLGAYTGVHQHARVGESVMSGSNAKLSLDAPPFATVAGDRARLVGLNKVGLERRGFAEDVIADLRRAFHIVFRSRLQLETALDRVRDELWERAEVRRLVGFLLGSVRGFCR